jgi:bifunctional non-homologous end joining protein LigD
VPGHRPLDTYRAKRDPAKTPGTVRRRRRDAPTVLRSWFVVQQHAARGLHWDLRLEWGGVLLSWAVPQGPSRDPADKRLAVQTEDHPLDYAEFEGLIPKGEYGGGAMIVWDRGRWVPLLDPDEGFVNGKQLFELHGFKLRGVWTLVRIKKDPKSWLLIKERDAWAASAKDGRCRRSIRHRCSRVSRSRSSRRRRRRPPSHRRARQGEVKAAPRAEDVQADARRDRREPFNKAGWIFELKYDGYRVLAGKRQPARAPAACFSLTRAANDATRTFPRSPAPCRAALRRDPARRRGRGARRERPARTSDSCRSAASSAARRHRARRARAAGDLLRLRPARPSKGKDLRTLPLRGRKELLQKLLPRTGTLRFADHVPERGADLFHERAASASRV